MEQMSKKQLEKLKSHWSEAGAWQIQLVEDCPGPLGETAECDQALQLSGAADAIRQRRSPKLECKEGDLEGGGEGADAKSPATNDPINEVHVVLFGNEEKSPSDQENFDPKLGSKETSSQQNATANEDVQYHEEHQSDEELERRSKRVTAVFKASTTLVVVLVAVAFSMSTNDTAMTFLLWIVVSLGSGLSSCLAALMAVVAPIHYRAHQHNIRATLLYYDHVFRLSFLTFLLAFFSSSFGALVAPSLYIARTPALLSGALPPVVAILTCLGARAHSIRKHSQPLLRQSREKTGLTDTSFSRRCRRPLA